MKLIILATPHHTGTWFLIKFIRAHPQVYGFSTTLKLWEALESEGKIVRNLQNEPEFLVDNRLALVHIHFDMSAPAESRYWVNTDHFVLILVGMPSVITVRDPLLSMISRYARRPDLINIDDLLFEWDRLVEIYPLIKDRVFFAPVDLPTTISERMHLLGGVLKHYGLPIIGYMTQWALKWPTGINSKGAYSLKFAYYEGDTARIKARIPYLWDGLQARRHKLQPFLEQLGYQDLLWWR